MNRSEVSGDLLCDYIEERKESFIRQYRASQDKYKSIWSLYEKQMPRCISDCDRLVANGIERDGPQGIYWIGAKPQILFVGREHFGWYGSRQWTKDRDRQYICCAPLEFAYFTIPSKGTYWAVVKELIQDVLEIDLSDWDKALEQVAFTNACKCLAVSQMALHNACLNQNYLRHEILTVAAPLNILFTKSLDLLHKLFPSETVKLYESEDFLVEQLDNQVLIECAHPGRKSVDWRQRLKTLITDYR